MRFSSMTLRQLARCIGDGQYVRLSDGRIGRAKVYRLRMTEAVKKIGVEFKNADTTTVPLTEITAAWDMNPSNEPFYVLAGAPGT